MSREPMGATDENGQDVKKGGGVVLVGYRGTGKSTVGRILAERTGRAFVEVDEEIVRRAGKTIRAIFEEDGEPAFRDIEEQVVRDLSAGNPDGILGTGGGTILREANRRAIRAHGLVAWLRADPDALARRLEADVATRETRPALTSKGALEEIAEVLEYRTPFYQEVADLIVETEDREPTAVAEAVLERWAPAAGSKAGREGGLCS